MSIALTGVNVFDGEQVVHDVTVVVRDGVIGSGEADEQVDLPGHWVLPGFIDLHAHIGLHDPPTVLRNGVTTVRDLGWPVEQLRSITDGPDVVYAGAILTAPGGYPSRAPWAPPGMTREVQDAADAQTAVDEQVRAGATVIKIAQEPRAGACMPVDVLTSIARAAHARGLRVTSHVGSVAELELAIEAGVDELAHGLWSDERIPDGTIERMVARGMTFVPTLHIEPTEVRIDNTGRYNEAGGRVLYGTDMGNPPTSAGIDVEEVRLMMRAGMSAPEVLSAATARAAEHAGLLDRGRVREGMRADLVVVEGDPFQYVAVLGRPFAVFKAGRRA